MKSLTQEFFVSCPVEKKFRMRGLEIARVEVFADVAFAFAVTMSENPAGSGRAKCS